MKAKREREKERKKEREREREAEGILLNWSSQLDATRIKMIFFRLRLMLLLSCRQGGRAAAVVKGCCEYFGCTFAAVVVAAR